MSPKWFTSTRCPGRLYLHLCRAAGQASCRERSRPQLRQRWLAQNQAGGWAHRTNSLPPCTTRSSLFIIYGQRREARRQGHSREATQGGRAAAALGAAALQRPATTSCASPLTCQVSPTAALYSRANAWLPVLRSRPGGTGAGWGRACWGRRPSPPWPLRRAHGDQPGSATHLGLPNVYTLTDTKSPAR